MLSIDIRLLWWSTSYLETNASEENILNINSFSTPGSEVVGISMYLPGVNLYLDIWQTHRNAMCRCNIRVNWNITEVYCSSSTYFDTYRIYLYVTFASPKWSNIFVSSVRTTADCGFLNWASSWKMLQSCNQYTCMNKLIARNLVTNYRNWHTYDHQNVTTHCTRHHMVYFIEVSPNESKVLIWSMSCLLECLLS